MPTLRFSFQAITTIFILSIVTVGCGNSVTTTGTPPATDSSATITHTATCAQMDDFPIPTAMRPTNEHMQALTGGELQLIDGCLRAGNHILVWPYAYKAAKCNDTVFVYNAEGKQVFRTGDTLSIGGGEAGKLTTLSNKEVNKPATTCNGITWIVGEIRVSGK